MLTDSRDKKRHEPKGSTSSQKAMKENDSEDWDDLVRLKDLPETIRFPKF